MRHFLLLLVAGLTLLSAPSAHAQRTNDDGFHRRNGQMHVLRNGQLRPMTSDAHLPTGVTVTKDGFLVTPSGARKELAEGQGCDLKGNIVAVRPNGSGSLALASPPPRPTAGASPRPVAGTSSRSARSQSLRDFFRGRGHWKKGKHKKGKKGKKWDD